MGTADVDVVQAAAGGVLQMDGGAGLLHVVHGSIVDGQSSSVDPDGRR